MLDMHRTARDAGTALPHGSFKREEQLLVYQVLAAKRTGGVVERSNTRELLIGLNETDVRRDVIAKRPRYFCAEA